MTQLFKKKIRNTTTESITLSFKLNEKIKLPTHTTAYYDDNSSQRLPVKWNELELAQISKVKGEYQVSGEVLSCEYSNPFIEERADPYIFKGPDNYYYFTASYPAFGSVDNGYDRIVLRRSETVDGLSNETETTIWKAHPEGNMAKHIWAPEIHYIKDKWYVFFAAGDKEQIWNIRPYVLMCDGNDPINDSWTECGIMKGQKDDTLSFTNFSLDMTYFENNGTHYLIWAQIYGDSSLFMATIDPEKPWQLTSKPVLLTKPEYEWEKVKHRVNEGASVLKIKDKVYVFFSASGTGAEYCMGVIYADKSSNLLDSSSWTKVPYPVLTTEDLEGEAGPGHNSFVINETGKILLVYHARPDEHLKGKCSTYCEESLYDPCRHARIKYVHITNEDIPLVNMRDDDIILPKNKTIYAKIKIV